MSRNSFALLMLLGGLVPLAILLSVTRGQDSYEPTLTESPDFANGILLVYIDRSSGIQKRRNSYLMKNAKLAKLGNKFFVRGIGYTPKEYEKFKGYEESRRLDGLDMAMVWNDVETFVVFTSDEQAETYFASLNKSE